MKKIVKLALILSLLMLSVSFAKSNSAASNNSKSHVTITFKVEGFEDIVWNIKNGHKVNQINDFHKKSGEFAKFVGIVDEWCVVEPKVQRACYTLQKLWSGPKFYSDAVIVGTVKKSFDITFVNYDGKKIVTVPTERDMVPVFPESEKAKLVREKTAKYSYSFKGWTPALVKATANATYYLRLSVAEGEMVLKGAEAGAKATITGKSIVGLFASVCRVQPVLTVDNVDLDAGSSEFYVGFETGESGVAVTNPTLRTSLPPASTQNWTYPATSPSSASSIEPCASTGLSPCVGFGTATPFSTTSILSAVRSQKHFTSFVFGSVHSRPSTANATFTFAPKPTPSRSFAFSFLN